MSPPHAGDRHRARRSPAELYGAVVVRLRALIVPLWIAGAVAAAVFLPTPGEAGGGALGSLVPRDAPALLAQRRSAELFAFPILSNTAIVQRDPDGLSALEQARILQRAARITREEYPDLLSLEFALPVINTFGLLPGSREEGTTAITFLFPEPGVSLTDRVKLAEWFTDRRFADDPDNLVGQTGVVPGQVLQGELIEAALPLVELATVLLIALVVGAHFRAVVAPVLAFAAVGISFLVSLGLVGWVGSRLGTGVPREVEPILLVLLLGIVTDYCIFFLSGLRQRLEQGYSRLDAARVTTADFTPIVGTAGLIVAGGAASLIVARLEFFRIFGPALALTVAVGLLVSITFVPAVIALLGRWLFWPSKPHAARPKPRRRRARRPVVVALTAGRGRAAAVALVVLVALGAAASGLVNTRLTLTPIRSLPDDTEPARAAQAAMEGFAPGVLMPTVVIVEEATLPQRRDALERLQRLIERQPGVAGVIGPGNIPDEVPEGVVVAPGGVAARFAVILEDYPLSVAALDTLQDLREVFPELLDAVGLPAGTASFAGNTAIAQETVRTMVADLARIALTVLVVNLVLLVLFLRAVVAPLYLLAASALAVAATLGLTTLLFQNVFGQGLTYYVPFMTAVLLVSLGSDYNVFLVGRIWQEARGRSLREATAIAAPRASRTIAVAALALALSFALLAIVPLTSFREFAFAMVVGVFIDAFVVRAYLVPALVVLFGPVSGWPSRLGRVRTVREVA